MILCVDPEEAVLEETRRILEDGGFETAGAGSAGDALDVLEADAVDGLVTEQVLPDGTGLELVRDAREHVPDLPAVLYTDRAPEAIDSAALGDVVAEYLRKDAEDADTELVALLEHAVSMETQTSYPLPVDEDARLAALERYADEPAALDASLGRLTRLATALFGVDSAAVGLVDAHHERFLACHGAEFGTIDREASVCTYAILDEAVTVIENVQADPRFEGDESLLRSGITFYAGAPLFTPEGHAIGTFCLQHDAPREFDADDRQRLRLFADEAMEQLTLRRRVRELTGGEAGE